MDARYPLPVLVVMLALSWPSTVLGEAGRVYVNARTGDDGNPGTVHMPVKTIQQAAKKLRHEKGHGALAIRIAPGIYSVANAVVFKSGRRFTEEDRLTIEATVLPDDPAWDPSLMPVILSIEDSRTSENSGRSTESYAFQVDVNHVTIRGLKFLGNPLMRNYHAAIARTGRNRDDLMVTQCLFIGNTSGLQIYCPVIGTGDRLVVDHCVFYQCHNAVVFWDGEHGLGGKGCAVRHCIIAGGYVSGVWTCETVEDLVFERNVVTGCAYFWMRKPGDRQKYRLIDSVITDCEFESGYGAAFGPFRKSGAEVTFAEERVIRKGHIALQQDRTKRDYLHVLPGTLGSELSAGLFKRSSGSNPVAHDPSQQRSR